MDVREVPLEIIDLEDLTYRISEDLDPAPIERSLRAVGQLNPVILGARRESAPLVVCGFRRLRALRRIGRTRCLARFLPPETAGPLSAIRVALWDNIAQRPLEILEKARVLSTLKHLCSVSQEELVEHYLPILGLEAHKNVLHSYLSLHLLDPDLKKLLAQGALPTASAERLAGMSPSVQTGVATLLARARFSASLLRRTLDLAADLAAIGECGIEDLLARTEVVARLNDASLSSFQRGEAVFKVLYRKRNPSLTAAEDRFEAGKSRLGLPGSVRLSPDPFFEQPRIRVEFEAGSADAFREASAALERAARGAVLDELFRVR